MTTRVNILQTGIHLTSGDRNIAYGEPGENLTQCAQLWNAYLTGKFTSQQVYLTAEDVAWLNVLQKIARTFSRTYSRDNYVDAATYSAIAGEVAEPPLTPLGEKLASQELNSTEKKSWGKL